MRKAHGCRCVAVENAATAAAAAAVLRDLGVSARHGANWLDLGADSLVVAAFLAYLETRTGRVVPDAEAVRCPGPCDVVDLVARIGEAA